MDAARIPAGEQPEIPPEARAEAVTDAFAAALADRTREAFTAVLTDDVRWGGERPGGGHECTGREEAGDHYAELLAAGVTLSITDLRPAAGVPGGDDRSAAEVFTAVVDVRSPDPDDHPPRTTVRLTLREGLVAEIRVFGPPPTTEVLHVDVADPTHEAAVAAVHAGEVPALQRLLADHPGLASTRSARRGGRTLLHVATDWPGHLPNVAGTIAALVAAGADPDAGFLGEHRETPLHWAASSDDVAALDALLDAGADIEARGAVVGGGTAMADATAFAQWAAARRLLDRGATTTLFEAACLGLLVRVDEHLRATPPPTAQEISSAFWGACHGGHVDVAAVLLDAGADLERVGHDGLTPLDAAHRSGASAVVDWLRRQGATGSSSAAESR